jgi:protein TonB
MRVQEATPLYRQNPVPEYPLIARRRGYQGTVVLEVLVSRDGKVKELNLSASSGHSVLDRAALASVKGWLFDPGTRGGEKVEMWVKVPVRFQLE